MIRGQTRARPRLQFKRVNRGWLGECRDKSCYYCSFKTKLMNQPGQSPGHKSEGSTWTDPRQCMNKNDYYHNFKNRFGSRSKTRFRSWVEKVNSVDPKFLFFSKIVNEFLTHVLSQVDLSFLLGQVELILPLFFLKLELVHTQNQPVKSVMIL